MQDWVRGRERNLGGAVQKQQAGPLVIHVIVNNIHRNTQYILHDTSHMHSYNTSTTAAKFCWEKVDTKLSYYVSKYNQNISELNCQGNKNMKARRIICWNS